MDHNSFRDFINRHEWIFAKTYATFCPHEYIVMKKLPECEWSLFPEIARFVRKEGFVAEYGRLGPNWYYIVDSFLQFSQYSSHSSFSVTPVFFSSLYTYA